MRYATLLPAAALFGLLLTEQTAAQSVKPAAVNEDYSWNIPTDAPRTLRYQPVRGGAEIVDGTQRFNRALYGAHSGFRLECSDLPEFGLYLPRMGGNLRFETAYEHCTARYEAGRMRYWIDDRMTIDAQVLRSEQTGDAALWRIENRGTHPELLRIHFGGVADKRFYREGDLGVDAPDCFDFKPEYCAGNVYRIDGDQVTVEYGSKERALLHLTLPDAELHVTEYPSLEAAITLVPHEVRYIALYPDATRADCRASELQERYADAERQRHALSVALYTHTPDDYISPIGAALALAADGLWSGQAWLHGAIGWRTPYSGWRGAYVGDALGWHERARIHFDTYAANQITEVPPVCGHPQQDTTLHLARAVKRWGTPMYSNGYITRRPGQLEEMSHYDMNLCYIDELLRHLDWTGDTEYAQQIFPVIERHLEWEKRNYDPDGDHLYDAYCCIWASDALYYSGGAVTHSSAYNYYANRKAAEIAELIGLDPEPYRAEAEAILAAMNRELWIGERGHWAEYRDLLGHRRLHTDAALWTIYHAIDSETADPFQAYAATRYVDTEIPHIAVEAEGIDPAEHYAVLSTTDWKPYSWSINNVAIAEQMHMALAYWQADRPEEAFRLMKSVALDNMYMGASPLNFGQISYYDAARGECYRDFGDPVGVWSRALVEGLYGIRPDGLHGRMRIRPGFPEAWGEADIATQDITFGWKRDGDRDYYQWQQRFDTPREVQLELRACGEVAEVTVNGEPVPWRILPETVGHPMIAIEAGNAARATLVIDWKPMPEAVRTGVEQQLGRFRFHETAAGELRWWEPEEEPMPASDAACAARFAGGFEAVDATKCEPAAVTFNASVSDIFKNSYLAPRPPYTTLQIPVQGIGEWCHPTQTAEIDDSGLRALVGDDGVLQTSLGIPFRTPRQGSNIAYTSLWENYPEQIAVPLAGRATHAYLLLAGSTNHMQYGVPNGEVRIRYTDGTAETVALVNPVTWVPIEQDLFYDAGAFRLEEGAQAPCRIHFGSGRISRQLGDELGIDGVYGRLIDGGAGLLLDVALDPTRELDRLELETLSNDVVIGLMAVTLQRE